jgi:hypothetical protein
MKSKNVKNKIMLALAQHTIVLVFSLSVVVPQSVFADTFSVTTGYPSSISGSLVVLSGQVNSSTREHVTAWFEYGTNESFQASSYNTGLIGNGELSVVVNGLNPGVGYVYRAAARKSNGQVVYPPASGKLP